MSEPMLFQLRRLRRHYGEGSFSLCIEHLDVGVGEFVCLLGPTGAGKSSLLRIMAGIEPPTAGEVCCCGRRVGRNAPPIATRRRIAMVFQRPLLLAGSVRVNVEYGLRLRGLAKSAGGRVDRVLNRLGLGRLASQPARTLSGGESQLVALARALVLEPDALLLDEPTAHLDPARVALVETVVREHHQQRGTTIVWTTHNLFQARRVAGRVGLLLSGELVEVNPTETFFERPSDPRTADFVHGKMVF